MKTFRANNRSAFLRGASLIVLSLGLAACSEQKTDTKEDTTAVADATPIAVELVSGKPELGEFGIDLTTKKEAVGPGENFFEYANGKWLDEFEIPEDLTNYGAFTVLFERSEEQVKAIIDDLSSDTEAAPGSSAQRVRDYYKAFMDVETINARGLEPIQPLLDKIAAIENTADLTAAFGSSQWDGTTSPITIGIGINRENPDEYQMSVGMGGLSLGDRDFYLNDDERSTSIREAFVVHVADMLQYTGVGEEEATAKAQAILALETKMAEIQWKRADRRNRTKTLNPAAFADLKAQHSDFDWDGFTAAGRYPDFDQLNVSYPDTVGKLITLVNGEDLGLWKDYLTYMALTNHASILTEEIYTTDWEFYFKTFRGVQAQRERWKRAVSRVGSLTSLGMDLGKIYVERHFKPEAKVAMTDLVANLRTALGARIEALDWMGAETKVKALEKLDAFNPKIAYPDTWETLEADIAPDTLYENVIALRHADIQRDFDDFNKPTDKTRWFMTPQTVNAYYNPQYNEIVFPAAILQPPFFDLYADPAVNYGGIGAVIGHEMGHGFDDQGSKSDARGVQTNWWTDEDRANFEKLADTLVEQYNGFEAIEGGFVDGRFTLGENIGDVGGLSMAYHAYKLSLNGEEAPIINGLTGDQRFFLAWAQVWKRKYRDETLRLRLKSDPHSPSEFRVNGVVANMDAWYAAFNISEDDPMYIPPEKRVTIW